MIATVPGSPTVNDSVDLQFTGAGCVNSTSQQRVGDDFQFYIDFSSLCFSPAPAYSYSWNVGVLPEGSYTASLYSSTDAASSALDTVLAFDVALFNPNAIPAMTHPGLVILCALLVVAALQARRRSR